MTALNQYFISSENKKFLTSFINILQKRGNKQRALSSFFGLFKQLKLGIAGFPIVDKYPLHTRDVKNPIDALYQSLYNLKPAFLIRRTIKSGRRYDLPVPISENRAIFMAIDWLRKTVFKNNKNDLSFTSLLAREISASLHHEGSAKDFLRAYIDIAIDQRPFSRFIKKKRFNVSKSKRTIIASRFEKIRESVRRTLRSRKYHNIGITRRVNKHNIRTTNTFSKKKRYKKSFKKVRKNNNIKSNKKFKKSKRHTRIIKKNKNKK
uniref:Ribosomal protein S7 n=1 Tax=Physarum polycephalum TaxID=5791 RepID=F2Y9V4_PHYPO|nr:ribosomal protein S7 [Physarum polycephalum]